MDLYGRIINKSSKNSYNKSLEVHQETLTKLNLEEGKITEYIESLSKIFIPL